MRFIPIFIIAILSFYCTKGKLTTIPQLKYKSVNSTTISGNETVQIKLTLSDKEADYTSLLGMKKTVSGCATSDFMDSLSFTIPDDFIKTKLQEGEVVVSLPKVKRGSNTCSLPGGGTRPDTTVFSFWTRDKAGNVSDTARTEKIIILN